MSTRPNNLGNAGLEAAELEASAAPVEANASSRLARLARVVGVSVATLLGATATTACSQPTPVTIHITKDGDLVTQPTEEGKTSAQQPEKKDEPSKPEPIKVDEDKPKSFEGNHKLCEYLDNKKGDKTYEALTHYFVPLKGDDGYRLWDLCEDPASTGGNDIGRFGDVQDCTETGDLVECKVLGKDKKLEYTVRWRPTSKGYDEDSSCKPLDTYTYDVDIRDGSSVRTLDGEKECVAVGLGSPVEKKAEEPKPVEPKKVEPAKTKKYVPPTKTPDAWRNKVDSHLAEIDERLDANDLHNQHQDAERDEMKGEIRTIKRQVAAINAAGSAGDGMTQRRSRTLDAHANKPKK